MARNWRSADVTDSDVARTQPVTSRKRFLNYISKTYAPIIMKISSYIEHEKTNFLKNSKNFVFYKHSFSMHLFFQKHVAQNISWKIIFRTEFNNLIYIIFEVIYS